eukprot:66673-Rhodomonas_salina.5
MRASGPWVVLRRRGELIDLPARAACLALRERVVAPGSLPACALALAVMPGADVAHQHPAPPPTFLSRTCEEPGADCNLPRRWLLDILD